jgi:hypothetical protein
MFLFAISLSFFRFLNNHLTLIFGISIKEEELQRDMLFNNWNISQSEFKSRFQEVMPHYSAYKPSLELEKKIFNETVIIIAAITIILGIIYLIIFHA